MYTEEQFEKDTQIITKFLYICAGVENSIVKIADDSDSITAGGIIDFFKDVAGRIKDQAVAGIKEHGIYQLGTYLLNGVLSFPLKIIAAIIKATTGKDLADLLHLMSDSVMKVIRSTGTFTQSDADRLSQVKQANLSFLYNLEKTGELNVFAKTVNATISNDIIKNAGIGKAAWDIFMSFLGRAPKGQQNSFGRGLLGWFFKILLTAIAGLVAMEGVKAISDEVEERGGSFTGSGDSSAESGGSSSSRPTQSLPQKQNNSFKPSGWGETYFINSGNNAWFVPLIGTPENTLFQWIIKVYPELKSKQQQIISSKAFNTMASILGNAYDLRSPKELQMPQYDELHTIKDVVDHSISGIV